MKVQSVNNMQSRQANFKAKFRQHDVSKFISASNKITNERLSLPNIYAMLQIIDSFPGKVARLKKKKDVFGSYYCVSIDSMRDIGKARTFFGDIAPLQALYMASVKLLKEASTNKFDTLGAEKKLKGLVQKNKNVTPEKIKNLAIV